MIQLMSYFITISRQYQVLRRIKHNVDYKFEPAQSFCVAATLPRHQGCLLSTSKTKAGSQAAGDARVVGCLEVERKGYDATTETITRVRNFFTLSKNCALCHF